MSERTKRPVPPAELHGKFVAWNDAGTEIVAFGDTFAEVRAKAVAAGEKRPRYERIPPANAYSLVTLRHVHRLAGIGLEGILNRISGECSERRLRMQPRSWELIRLAAGPKLPESAGRRLLGGWFRPVHAAPGLRGSTARRDASAPPVEAGPGPCSKANEGFAADDARRSSAARPEIDCTTPVPNGLFAHVSPTAARAAASTS